MTTTRSELNAPPTIPGNPPGPARWFWVLISGAVIGLGILYRFNPVEHSFYPTCQFYQLTHLHCPGCGSLRALHHLTHGEITAAFHSNPLLIVSLPLFAWLGFQQLRTYRQPAVTSAPIRPAIIWTLFGITIVFGILRNLPGPAFAWMSP